MKKLLSIALFAALVSSVSFAGGRKDGITLKPVQFEDPSNHDASRTYGEAVADIKAPADKVWAILMNFNGLKNWMPNAKDSTGDFDLLTKKSAEKGWATRIGKGDAYGPNQYWGVDAKGRSLAYLVCSLSILGTADMLNAYDVDEDNMALVWNRIEGTWAYMHGETALEAVSPTLTRITTKITARSGIALLDTNNGMREKLMKDTLGGYIVNIRGMVNDN